MSEKTTIEWCDSTVNPTMGCDGCELWNDSHRICYAGRVHDTRAGRPGYAPTFDQVTIFPGRMKKAAEWADLSSHRRPDKPWLDGLPRLIFISDMSDLLCKTVSFEYILDEVIWQVLNEQGMRHHWLWLTKRAGRMAEFSYWLRHVAKVQWPRNLWVGTSVTTQQTVPRVQPLLHVGNVNTTRFVSVEPQWEPVALGDLLQHLDWVIQGGESGSAQHPFDVAWADSLRNECNVAGVPYFLKQLGAHVVNRGQRLRLESRKGDDWSEWPRRLRVRQVPGRVQTSRRE
jgi:protein gp37